MAIGQAIGAALTGLQVTQAQSAVVSRNIANAQTPGYVRKEAELSPLLAGGQGVGVKLEAVSRRVDEFLLRDVRNAASRLGEQQVIAEALGIYTEVIGQPQDERSLASALGVLDRELGRLGETPESAAAQQSVLSAADGLVSLFHRTDQAVRQLREDADAQIAESVATINRTLQRIQEIGRELSTGAHGSGDITDLADERDRLLDELAQEIPIRTLFQDDGEAVILTQGGVSLLDGDAVTLDFTRTTNIQASMVYDPLTPGGLGGVEIGGTDIAPGSGYPGAIGAGRLAGLFRLRDDIGVRFQVQIDQAASRLIDGFQSADATVTGAPPGDTGLFTDAGTAHTAVAFAPGLAGRVAVNDQVRPAAGGELWRIRDGVQAATPGLPGDPSQVRAFEAVFDTVVAFDPAAGLQTTATLLDFTASTVADQHARRAQAESTLASERISHDTLATTRLNRDGVNIDDEMQKMLIIERSYVASAQVLAAANRMLDRLFEM